MDNRKRLFELCELKRVNERRHRWIIETAPPCVDRNLLQQICTCTAKLLTQFRIDMVQEIVKLSALAAPC